jgi:hypothetical protein
LRFGSEEIVAMNVAPQHLAEQAVDVLGVGRNAAIAERHIEILVRTETDPARLVIGDAVGLIDANDELRACRIGAVRIRAQHGIAAHLGVVTRIGEIDIKLAVRGEIRVESEPEQAGLRPRS